MEVKLAYYRKKDWKRYIKIVDDPENMHDTWFDWHKDYEKMKQELTSKGFVIIDIVVDLDELLEFCKFEGIRLDGKARAEFVQQK